MKVAVVILSLVWPACIWAQGRDFSVSAAEEIRETGFMQYLLPRFAVKHGVRVAQVPDTGDVTIALDGDVPVFEGLGQVWKLTHTGSEGALIFAEWLRSDTGKRTIAGFTVDGVVPFAAYVAAQPAATTATFEGDVIAGQELAILHCGRCHVINETNRMKGMGQTPSFGLMRTFTDWQDRFSAFYALNPHPSFTQISGITQPFDISRPPAIFPLTMTQTELESILAYVATIPPSDLGAPLQSQ